MREDFDMLIEEFIQGTGFWENYAFQYLASDSRFADDVYGNFSKPLYVLWCYIHMSISEWIFYLLPPFIYNHGNDFSYWYYWFFHVVLTVAILGGIWKIIRFIFSGDLIDLFKQSYDFDTKQLADTIKLAQWYQSKKDTIDCTLPVNQIYTDRFKSISDICVEIWLEYDKKSYATILSYNDMYAISLYDDNGKQMFCTKCKIGETITFGSKKEHDKYVVRLFNSLSRRLDSLNERYSMLKVKNKI